MKKAYLILFTSLILIFSCGSCVQANITEEYIEYTFNHFQKIDGLSSYQGNANNILKTLTVNDYNFYNTYLNQVLKENELSRLGNKNLITFFDANWDTVNIYFIFSNVSVPNGVENLGFLKLSRVDGNDNKLNFSCYGNDEDYIYYVKLNITSNSHNGFETVKKINNNSSEVTCTYYLKSSSLNDENSVLTISNVACMQTQAIYYHIPFTTSGTRITYTGFIKGLSVSEDDPGYFKKETTDVEGNSGDSGTTGGSTGSNTTDLSKVENGINNINQNIDKTNGKLDDISGKIPTSEEIQDATENGVINGNTSFWGDSEDLTGEEQEKEINNIINSTIENISGELSKREELKLLEDSQKMLIKKFTNARNLGEQYMDLVLEWQDIKYNGITIIEAGKLNISELVSNNEALSTVHGYIKIITNYIVIMNILKTIYNLILEILGINEKAITLEYEDTKSIEDRKIVKLNK